MYVAAQQLIFKQGNEFHKINNSNPQQVVTNKTRQQMKVQTADTTMYQQLINPSQMNSPNQYFSPASESKHDQQQMAYRNNLSNASLQSNGIKRYQSRSRERPTKSSYDNLELTGAGSNNLGRIVHKLENRIQGTQIKIASLTNVVKLLQKYTENKDIQYEKEKENALFNQGIGERVSQSDSLQLDNKIREFNLISQKIKKQCEEISEFKQNLEQTYTKLNNFLSDQKTKNLLVNPNRTSISNKKLVQSPPMISSQFSSHRGDHHQQNFTIQSQDLAVVIEEMESRLRQQINKKTDICLKQISRINLSISQGMGGGNVVVDNQNVLEEQINHVNHLVSQLENECLRNKMAIERYMETDTKVNLYDMPLERSVLSHSRDKSVRNSKKTDRAKDRSSSPSLRNVKKSPVNEKSRNNSRSRKVFDKKRIKEEELLEAISRKKQTREKLKNRHF